MVKVTGPMHSETASGSFAKSIVFSIWKGRAYVRQLVKPSNPRSEGQVAQRAALASGGRFNSFVDYGSALGVSERESAPSGQSGPAYFAQLQSTRFADSKDDYENATYSTQKGYFDTAAGDMSIPAVTIPGATTGDNLVVPPGLILWNAYSACNFMDDTLAPSSAITATSGNIDTFQAALAE